MEISHAPREYQRVLHYLYGQIREGHLQIGDRLPTERTIAETLCISRNSIREALRTLEYTGVIQCRRGSGNYLTGNAAQSVSGLVEMMLLLHQTSREEVCAFRRNMEKTVCSAILEENTLPRWQKQLTEILQKMEQTEAETARIRLDQQFHDTLLQATENRFWILLVGAVAELYHQWIAQANFHADAQRKAQLLQTHRALLEALLQGDYAACCRAVDLHYELATEELLA